MSRLMSCSVSSSGPCSQRASDALHLVPAGRLPARQDVRDDSAGPRRPAAGLLWGRAACAEPRAKRPAAHEDTGHLHRPGRPAGAPAQQHSLCPLGFATAWQLESMWQSMPECTHLLHEVTCRARCALAYQTCTQALRYPVDAGFGRSGAHPRPLGARERQGQGLLPEDQAAHAHHPGMPACLHPVDRRSEKTIKSRSPASVLMRSALGALIALAQDAVDRPTGLMRHVHRR
jgi:hypothetical protein